MKKILKINEAFLDSSWFKKLTYSENVMSNIYNILENVYGISEKDFNRLDRMFEIVKPLFKNNEFIKTTVDEFESKKRRTEYCAEYIYDLCKDTLFKLDL